MHTVPKINWVCVLPELEKSNIASSACSSIGNKSFSLAERKKKKRKEKLIPVHYFSSSLLLFLFWCGNGAWDVPSPWATQ